MKDHKDILVAALVGDGTTLPAVVITGKVIRGDPFALGEDWEQYAHVLTIKGAKGPSTRSTTATLEFWLRKDWITPARDGQVVFIMDRLPGHLNTDGMAV